MKLVIMIERKELDELFAVGPKDLINYLIPEAFNVRPEDVKACWFEEVDDKDAKWQGREYTVIKHQDNLYSINNKKGKRES